MIPAEVRWERDQLPLLVENLAEVGGAPHAITHDDPPHAPAAAANLSEWIEAACARLGVEGEPAHCALKKVEAELEYAAPALVRLPDGGFVGLAAVRRERARLITTDLRSLTIPLSALRDALCAPAESAVAAEVDRLLDGCELRRPERARRAFLRNRAAAAEIDLGWQIRVPPGSDFVTQATHAGMHGRLLLFVASYGGEYALSLGAWWLLGQAALGGRFELGWMIAWTMLMATSLLLRIVKSSSSERLAVGIGGLLKQRLLAGSMRLNPDALRRDGAGGMLARVIESEALESLAVGGGLAAIFAPLELIAAGVILWLGAGGAIHAALLAAWAATLGWFIWRDVRVRGAWMESRMSMTADLVERMTGHRTRLAQEQPERWHAGEDQALADYLDRSSALDRSLARVHTLVPRLWLLTGIAALAPAFLRNTSESSLAVSVAAVLLAQRSLRTLASGFGSIAGAALAWRQAGPLFSAAENLPERGAVAVSSRTAGCAVLQAHDLTYRYHDRPDAVLRSCSLTMQRGDWVVLEGPSGNGKSTLASLVTGLRTPESGLLLAGGLDRSTLGESRWRRRIAYAPQAHENHIFSGTLAFNLLMGRTWPPRYEDMAEADEVCRDLGLGDLLARMPAGLEQIVGESGWQLSEGERSRIFLARALLAGGDLVVLDECFAALDPESLELAYRTLHRRAETVLMVAHP